MRPTSPRGAPRRAPPVRAATSSPAVRDPDAGPRAAWPARSRLVVRGAPGHLNGDGKDGQARTGVTGTLRRRRRPPITAHAPPPPSRHSRRRRPGRRDRNRLLRDEKAALGRARDGSDGRDGRPADDPRDGAADTLAPEGPHTRTR